MSILPIMLISSGAFGATLNVPADYDTITEAIEAAVDGDLIQLAAGNYDEHVVVYDLNLKIAGAGIDLTTWESTADTDGSTQRYEILFVDEATVDVSALNFESEELRAIRVANGRVVIEDVSIKEMKARSYGGAVNCSESDLTMTRVTMDEVKADIGGGLYSSNCTVIIRDSDLTNGTAEGWSDWTGRGGLIYANEGSLTINDSTITNGTVSTRGGLIYAETTTVTITDSTLMDGLSEDRGGLIHLSYGELNLTGSTLNLGDAVNYGGLIVAYDAPITIDDSILSNGTAGLGGALDHYTFGGDRHALSITNSIFSENDAEWGPGGAIFAQYTGAITISDTTFDSNFADEEGGAIYVADIEEDVLLTSNTYLENEATENGGAIHAKALSNLRIQTSDFIRNSSEQDGGALSTEDTQLFALRNLWCDNSAQDGGGIQVDGESEWTTLHNNRFVENEASNRGGGIRVRQHSANIVNNTFVGNSAYRGAGVQFHETNEYYFQNNLVSWNPAGDGIYVNAPESDEETVDHSSHFTYNAWYENVTDHSNVSSGTLTLDSTNVFEHPLISAYSNDGDCDNDELWQTWGSPLIDAGDPLPSTTTDPDGSRSDIGAYGGEQADPDYFVDADGDGYILMFDCDDADAAIHPEADEYCDDKDNDCDGVVDEDPVDASTWYQDSDEDGFGDPDTAVVQCDGPASYITNGEDCDDTRSDVHPGADEVCNEIDDNCDEAIDNDAIDASIWYVDFDADGFGSEYETSWSCTVPEGFVGNDDDCDDARSDINPSAPEVCDDADIDEDCDGKADDSDPEGAEGTGRYYEDADNDGFGDSDLEGIDLCDPPEGLVSNDTDCDDSNKYTHPEASELCDDMDNDCDGEIDEDVADLTWYLDEDGDEFGNPDASIEDCNIVDGYVLDDTDCDDNNPDVHPGAEEIIDNAIDEDCDGLDGDSEIPTEPTDEDIKVVGGCGCQSSSSPSSMWPGLLAGFLLLLAGRRSNKGSFYAHTR